MLLCWVACTDPSPTADEGRRYAEALVAIRSAPSQATTRCAPLTPPSLRGDCYVAGAQALARQDIDAAAALCDALPAGLHRDECRFVLAEHSGEMARCARAGRFEEDCQMHLLGQAAAHLTGAPGEVEPAAEALIVEAGLSADDVHAWTLIYRRVLGQQDPLDLSTCTAAGTRGAHCQRAGLGLLSDRLNFARDTGLLVDTLCADGSLPPVLNAAPDPKLTALIASRDDLCPEGR